VKFTVPTILALFVLSVAACSRGKLPVSVPVNTSAPPVVPTATVMPTGIVLPTKETLPPDWQGIPILPEALLGEGDDEGYVFTARVTVEQVRMFYETELPILGWEAIPSTDASTLLFGKENENLIINIIAKGDEVLVLLTK